MSEMNITFIGGGNMAAALIAGLAGKVTASAKLHVVDLNGDTLQKLRQQYGVGTALQIDAAVASSDVIVMAVKPQQMQEVAAQLLTYLKPEQLVLSIAAGIRAADLSRWLNGHAAVVRTMPNTPALIGMGITGMVALNGVSANQKDTADALMRAVGATVWLSHESLIDALTAVSGSGPAYVFYFMEAMQAAAQTLGLSPEQGKELVLATFAGASQLALQSPDSLTVLRERVTSKGGTTHAALVSMETGGVREAIAVAMQAAADRARELGDEYGKG